MPVTRDWRQSRVTGSGGVQPGLCGRGCGRHLLRRNVGDAILRFVGRLLGLFSHRSAAPAWEARRASLAIATSATPAHVMAPYISEAISRLGYVEPEFKDWVIAYAVENELTGLRSASLRLRKEAPQLSSAEKKALGLRSSAFYSRRMFDVLTPVGRRIPLEALDTTVRRALFRLARTRDIERGRAVGATHFLVRAVWPERCAGCKAFDKRRYAAGDVPVLPLPGCWRGACAVSFAPDLDGLR